MSAEPHENASDAGTRSLIRLAQITFIPTGMLTTLLGPMLPILIARWKLTDAQAGDLFLVQFLGALAGVQVSGALLRKTGFRMPFLAGLIFMALAVAAIFPGPAWRGFAAITACGFGLGLIIPTDNLLIAELSAGTSAAQITLLNFYWGVGAILCSVAIAWAYAQGVLRGLLWAIAAFLIWLLFAIRQLPFPPEHVSVNGASSAQSAWSARSAWIFAAVFFLYPGAETAVGGWVGSYVSRSQAEVTIGPLVPAIFWLGLSLGRWAGSIFLRHYPERRVFQSGLALGSAGIVTILYSTSLAAAFSGELITGIGFATIYPITIARFSRHYGLLARRLGVVMFSMGAIGPAVVPWAVGIVSSATGSLRAGLVLPLMAILVIWAADNLH